MIPSDNITTAANKMVMWTIIIVLSLSARLVNSECSYDCEENSLESSGYSGLPIAPGLPPSTVLGGKVVQLDEIAPTVFLNRTKAWLNCANGIMQIDLKFEEPFNGIVYADFDRRSSCSILGTGETTARMELPLKGCGTKQDPVRVFTNNLIVRFHPALEMDGDEVITIVCRYPPPIAPPPPTPEPLQVNPPSPAVDQPLKGFQILLVICGILFLSLVLFGLAMSYYCLKNQKIRVVRRYPIKDEESHSGAGSTMSMFDTLKIPRAHALTPIGGGGGASSTASETAHGSETLPSDYPSETPSTAHSEAEDVDSRRRSISSGGSFDNKAYIPDISILTQEQLLLRNETEVESHETTTRFRPPPPEPKFDVQMRIKKPPLPSPSPSISSSSSSDTEVASSIFSQERNLLTIRERDETTLELSERRLPTTGPNTFTYRPEIHSPPKSSHSPPIYSEVMRRGHDKTVPVPSTTWRSEQEIDREEEEEESTRYSEEERYYHQRRSVSPPNDQQRKRTELLMEPPLIPSRRPEITSHIVDDVFLRTITEKKTIEDIERHRRQVTEYMARPQLPAPKWDVVIRNYPNPNAQTNGSGDDTATDWESFSESSSIYGIPVTTASSSEFKSPQPQDATLPGGGQYYRSQMDIEKQYSSTLDIPIPDPMPANWNALISVLDQPPEVLASPRGGQTYRTEKTLTLEDKRKWRKIITTESTLRTLLTEAVVREDYERIRRDERYVNLFEPETWEVIVRVATAAPYTIAPNDSSAIASAGDRLFDQRTGAAAGTSGVRYRKKTTEWDSRSNRRSSLPTLYEYDSDGSSIRNLNLEAAAQVAAGGGGVGADVGTEAGGSSDPFGRSRRTSRSSLRSDIDVRSMSEVMVNFARQEVPDNVSEASSYYRRSSRRYDDDDDEDDDDDDYIDGDSRSLVRSVSQPSLARSASEFTENWGIRDRNWDLSSPEHSPRSSTRSKKSGFSQRAGTSAASYSVRRQSLYQQQQQQQQHQQHQHQGAVGSRQQHLWYKDKEHDSE